MKQKRSNEKQRSQKAAIIRSKEINEMAEHKPDEKAAERFRRKPYQAAALIREQGAQMKSKSAAEYFAEKYGIKGMEDT